MMRSVKMILLLVFTGVIPVSCCEEVLPYAQADSLSLELSESCGGSAFIDGEATKSDTLALSTLMEVSHLAQGRTALFTSPLYAYSCREHGEEGFRDKIWGIEITCNRDFHGIPAGTAITRYVTVNGYPSGQVTLEEAILQANREPVYGQLHRMCFNIAPKPVDTVSYRFKVDIRFNSGRHLAAETVNIKWK